MTDYTMTSADDNFIGTDEGDVFLLSGSSGKLSAADVVKGGGGIDILRYNNGALAATQLAGFNSIEVIDLSGITSAAAVSLNAHTVAQAGGSLQLIFGASPLSLDVSQVLDAGTVIVGGSGLVTLRNFKGQSITFSDGYDGRVTGGTLDDRVRGGSGNDTFGGGAGDDDLVGGDGSDSLDGGDGDDFLSGGNGADTLTGGAGHDLIRGGTGINLVSAGAGSDTFEVTIGERLRIADFDVSDLSEFIDLRLIAGAASFADLAVLRDGTATKVLINNTEIVLEDVDSGSLSGRNFLFLGDDRITVAAIQSTEAYYTLSSAADIKTGTAGNDVFAVAGAAGKLTSIDAIDGGAGTDTIRLEVTNPSLSDVDLSGVRSIERIDLTGSTGNAEIHLGAQNVSTALNKTIEIVFGGLALTIDTALVEDTGTVILSGYGDVKIRNFGEQRVQVDDHYDGRVIGGSGSNDITGGAGSDTLSGGISKDSLSGGDGDDTLSGGEQDDHLYGGNGHDTLDGGADDDHLDGGAGDDTLVGGQGDDTLIGGAGTNTLNGGEGNDSLTGGEQNDDVIGGNGDDRLVGGAGSDILDGGNGDDFIQLAGGDDTASGGVGYDNFVILNDAGSHRILDFQSGTHLERVDLGAFASATSLAALSMDETEDGVLISLGETSVLLAGEKIADLRSDDFVFFGQDKALFHVSAGTSASQIEILLQGAPPGSVIELAAGDYYWNTGIKVTRGDITLRGAGEGQTIIHSSVEGSTSQLVFQSLDDRKTRGVLSTDIEEGANHATFTTVDRIKVGDVVYIGQPNDDAYLKATGNEKLIFPDDSSQSMVPYYLREAWLEVTGISGNTLTFDKPLPYSFGAGKAFVATQTFLKNVEVSGISFQVDGAAPDPYNFSNENSSWKGSSMISFDGIMNSTIQNVSILNARSASITMDRTFRLSGDAITINGAHNKEPGDGYGIHIKESFENNFTHLDIQNVRHGILFSSFSAEHYNNFQIDFTNRDVNFHGSFDANNNVYVKKSVLDYNHAGDNNVYQFKAVQGTELGNLILPTTTVDANDVRFGHVVGADHDDTVHAFQTGGYLSGADGNDILYGGDGRDTLLGGRGNDLMVGGGNSDLFVRDLIEAGHDRIIDFDARPTSQAGDLVVLRGYGLGKFADLQLRQLGGDTVIDFGNRGLLTLANVLASTLSATNFRFDLVGKPQIFTASGAPTSLIGSDGDDVVTIDKGFITRKTPIFAGRGEDTVVLAGGFLNATTDAFGEWHSVDRFDVSKISSVSLKIGASSFFTQNSSKVIDLLVGDAGILTLDVGAPTDGGKLMIDGGRTIMLSDTRSQIVYSTDRIGTDLHGGTQNDTLLGGNKADKLSGGAGVDSLNGGAGDDTLDGGVGADVLAGGAGNDLYYVDNAGDIVVEALKNGVDTIVSSVTWDLEGPIVENLTLSGSRVVNGFGNSLANVILGNDAANSLYGRGGNDTLIGGLGQDSLSGGTGADKFVFRTGELASNAATADRVTDFRQAEKDVIDLAAIDAVKGGGDNDFKWIGNSDFSGTAGELRYQQSSGYALLRADIDGDGKTDLILRVDGVQALLASDFIL